MQLFNILCGPIRNILFWIIAFHFSGNSQVTWHVFLPDTSPSDSSSVYIACTSNGWNPAHPDWKLKRTAGGYWQGVMYPDTGRIEWKVTRGSWSSAEGAPDGKAIPNRSFRYDGQPLTLAVTVNGWEASVKKKVSTRSPNVHILSDSLYISVLGRYRQLRVYLPPEYQGSEMRYPVLYMLDGQNVFDEATSYAGEWRVDETLDSLAARGLPTGIVVAIDNGESHRMDEYSPWKHPEYGGGEGYAFLAWVANEVKPWIDTRFRTLPSRTCTGIAGSSMGGLAALYAWLSFPDTFGFAGVFSPSLWFSEGIRTRVNDSTIRDTSAIYLCAGTLEGESMVSDAEWLASALRRKGLNKEALLFRIDAGKRHQESYWAGLFGDFWQWSVRCP